MTEYDLIRNISMKFPRSRQQLNGLFECDAELIQIGDQTWGMSMDEFSPEEDRFTSDQPEILGANLAVATLSDLFAAGIEPRFFMHALSLPKNCSASFSDALMNGIKSILAQTDCHLLGGDLGTAETWRYCGFAMGQAGSNGPITRKLKDTSKKIWITGYLGDANLAVLNQTPTPAFELRHQEAELIRKHATGCIDTSGGLMDALWTLHMLNPHLQILLHPETIPWAAELCKSALPAGIPREAALTGGAGEYELLFATPADLSAELKARFESMGITAIADVSEENEPGLFVHRGGRNLRALTVPPPCPRAIPSMSEYVQTVISYSAELFGENRR